MPVVAAAALWFTFHGGNSIVALLLMGYSLVTQLFPSLVCSLLPRNPLTTAGAIAGLVAGELTVAWITMGQVKMATLLPAAPGWVQDLNVGFVALLVNLLVAAVVSSMTRRTQSI